MSRRRKFWLGFGLAVIGLVALAIAAGVLLVRSAWFSEKVRQRILREVEQSTGGRAEIGAFHFDWREMRAEARSFVLRGTEGPGERPLFEARLVQVGLKIVSALLRDIDISLLRLEQPKIHIIVYPDGATNLPQPPVARRSSRNAIEQMLDLSIGELSIEGGLLAVNSRLIPLDLNGAELRARLFYDARAPSYGGRVSFENLLLKSPVTLPVGFGANFSVTVKSGEVAISEGHLFTKRSSIRAGGAIRNLQAPRADVRFDAELASQEWAQLLRLPVDVQGVIKLAGTTSFAGSDDYSLEAQLAGSGLELRYRKLRLTDIRAVSDLKLSPGRAELEGMRLSALGGEFAGKAFVRERGRFGLEGELRDISVERLLRLAELKTPAWSGRLSGVTSLQGQLDRWPPRNVTARSRLAVVAEAGQLPLQGALDIDYDQSAGIIELGDSYLSSPSSEVRFQGTLGRSLRLSLQSEKLEELMPLVSAVRSDVPQSLPISLERGSARFEGLVTGPIDGPRVSGRISLESFRFRGRRFSRFDGDVGATASSVRVRSFSLRFEDMRLQGELEVGLGNWKAESSSPLAGSFAATNVRLGRILAEAGSQVSVDGIASGSLTVGGTVGAPEWRARASITAPVVYGERFDTGRVEASYAGDSVDVHSASVESGTERLFGKGSFRFPPGDSRNGTLRFELSGNSLPLSRLAGPDRFPGVTALLEFDSRGEVAIQSARPQLESLAGALSISDIRFDGQPAGDVKCIAETKESSLLVRLHGEIAGARISGQSAWRLDGKNQVKGDLEFSRLALSSLRPWWAPAAGGTELPMEGHADGRISFSGEGFKPAGWKALMEVPTLVIAPETVEADPHVLRLTNEGPVLMSVDNKALRVERAVLSGKDTHLTVSGGIEFVPENSVQLRLRGAVNLAVLRNFDPDLTASGNSTLDATVRGRASSPEIFGRLEFENGSFYLSDVPNGIDKASGVIAFSRDRATIENLTAETGGGKLTFGGFIGFGGEQIVYRLQVEAAQVRVRYPEGVSTTADASLNLTGTSTNSTLSGNVTILRSSISPRVDLAGMFAQSLRPLVTPGTQNKLLRGMLFDVRVQSSPNARLDTALTRDIQAEADLRLRGTSYKPVLLGRISATQGEVSFLGTKYSINRGDVSFLNPVKLDPVVNMDLATRVMGTEVSITFAGPLDRLNVTYRSDPPLQPSEIIALLAVGRAPSTDPTVMARQAELDQSNLGQLGATAVIGEALAAPVTGRLQRFFGVSRIRIDPRLTGVENNPQTQLTLEQQVSRDVTFTYITNVSRGQEQVIRVEWNVNRRWSIVALRDENGLFGIDVLFRKQFR